MQKLLYPQGGGKTDTLIKISAETGAVIVCSNIVDIISRATKLDFKIPDPITYYEFATNRYNQSSIKEFLIDDVDQLVQAMTHVKIQTITLRIDDQNQA